MDPLCTGFLPEKRPRERERVTKSVGAHASGAAVAQEQQLEPSGFLFETSMKLRLSHRQHSHLGDTCPPVSSLLRGPQERGTGEEAEKKGMVIPLPEGRVLGPQHLTWERETLQTLCRFRPTLDWTF